MSKVSLFGATGFILGRYAQKYKKEVYIEERNNNVPKYNNILYGISTVSNYNIFSDIFLDVNTNLIKLLQVLENCKKNNTTFTYLSSWFVYSGCKSLPAKENDTGEVLGFYGATKKAAESLLITFCEVNKINWRILRLCNIFGQGDKFSKQKNALQYLINEIKNGRDIELYWGGDFQRDYLDVNTCCKAIHHLINKSPPNQIYNVGSGVLGGFKFLDLMNFVRNETGSKSKFITIEPKPFHSLVQIKDMYLDISKLTKTGFKHNMSITEELKKIL